MKCHKEEYELRRLFHQAKNDEPEVSFEDTRAAFMGAVSTPNFHSKYGKKSSFFSTKVIVIMTTILSVIGIGVMMFSNLFNVSDVNKSEHKTTEIKEQDVQWMNSGDSSVREEQRIMFVSKNPTVLLPEDITEENFEMPFEVELKEEEMIQPFIQIEEIPKKEEAVPVEAYRFPTLTAEEVKENQKRKSKLIKQVIKMDKKRFSEIPNGNIQVDGISVSVNSFAMLKTEVSNLDYLTFLFDLLISDRKDEFLIAKPDQTQWREINDNLYASMAEYYFSHPAFGGYPVNNISRAGAEMYCKWLTNEVNRVLEKKGKKRINDVRIPTNIEWVYAAKGGIQNSAYPWGGPYAKNDRGCYLANFRPEGEPMDEDGIEITAPVWSYAPNNYGLFCMSGNVAEMVYYGADKSKPGARGGSWTSGLDEIQIDGKDRFIGVDSANVNIGFRYVISLP